MNSSCDLARPFRLSQSLAIPLLEGGHPDTSPNDDGNVKTVTGSLSSASRLACSAHSSSKAEDHALDTACVRAGLEMSAAFIRLQHNSSLSRSSRSSSTSSPSSIFSENKGKERGEVIGCEDEEAEGEGEEVDDDGDDGDAENM
jgi:hypothetical protein